MKYDVVVDCSGKGHLKHDVFLSENVLSSCWVGRLEMLLRFFRLSGGRLNEVLEYVVLKHDARNFCLRLRKNLAPVFLDTV